MNPSTCASTYGFFSRGGRAACGERCTTLDWPFGVGISPTDTACDGLGMSCNASQTTTLSTESRIQQVAQKTENYCAKYFAGTYPTLEYYGGRECWYFNPSNTLQQAINACSVESAAWNKRVSVCLLVNTEFDRCVVHKRRGASAGHSLT